MSAVGGNYISDAALLAWVTAQQDRLYGDLKATMDFQQLQGEMTSDLADIKQKLLEASKDPSKYQEVEAELEQFAEKYGDVPEFADISQAAGEIQEQVTGKLDDVRGSAVWQAVTADYMVELEEFVANGGDPEGPDAPEEPDISVKQFNEGVVDSWIKQLDEKLDASGVNEQLGMIHLNELKTTIDQSSQQTSQLLKSNNDTTSSIINNFA